MNATTTKECESIISHMTYFCNEHNFNTNRRMELNN